MSALPSTIAAALLLGVSAATVTACGDDGGVAVADPPSALAPSAPADSGAAVPRDDGPDASADSAPTCALSNHYGSPDCMACVASTCCAQVSACDDDADCKPLQKCAVDCIQGPDPRACRDACISAMPAGMALWTAVNSCWNGADFCLKRCGWRP